MKFFPFVVFLLLVSLSWSSVAAQERRFVSQEDKLLGPVHTVQVELGKVIMKGGKEVSVSRRPHQKIVYDRRGNEIERINYNERGGVENRAVQIIDANGRHIGYEGYETDADGKSERLTGKSEAVFDERGNRVEVRVYQKGEQTIRTTSSYDAAGNVLEEVMITDGGAYKQTKKNSYDKEGRLIKTVFDTNGRLETMEQTYDTVGNRVTYNYISSNNSIDNSRSSKYRYNEGGKEIEHTAEDALTKFKLVTTYDAKGRVSRQVTQFDYKKPNIINSHSPTPGTVEFRYNDNDQVIEESYFSLDGKLKQKLVNKYDKDGRLRSYANFNGDGEETGKVINDYDQWGNCVKSLNISTGLLGRPEIHVTYRVITYY